MEEWSEAMFHQGDLIQELRDCTDPVREIAIVEEMEKLHERVDREVGLMTELHYCTDPVREVAVVEEIERLQEQERCLAFAEKPNQQEYNDACS